ncbi:MAG TPA: NAD-dependent epimerase/dehydratase family protein [Caulobacteraceae bacterium]|jgi:nucleoside-diphosphate-sugar epimerase|nr:NAD-dependent epimerase/dehydratase family protein [Caulobacteraceae bacterium]
MRKTVLIAGASGLVGVAATKHFAAEPECDVVVVSRRRPHDLYGARFVSVDLMDDAACARLGAEVGGFTHLVYTALHERPELIAGWRDETQIHTNDRMLRRLFGAVEAGSPALRHVTLLQGTKAYGVHVRPIPIPAREDRDEARDVPNFYWLQEDFLKERQHGRDWHWTVFRPQVIFGESFGSAMNLIPAIGAYAALLKADGQPLHFPGGAPNLTEGVDADLLARAIAWAGDSPAARDGVFNITNGDLFIWREVWPAIADALGMRVGASIPMSLAAEMPNRAADWECVRSRYGLASPALGNFVGLSFQYADSVLGHSDARRGDPALVSTIKLRQAGFYECIDTEAMLHKWFRLFQEKRFLPPA